MSSPMLVAPHRTSGSWRADCAASGRVYVGEVSGCPQCLASGVLSPLLSAREAAERAGITYKTWRNIAGARRPAADFVDDERRGFWSSATIDRWVLFRRQRRSTARRVAERIGEES